jgi:uncharacterized surface protein with fasciclin (FAS1) repeats
MSLIKRYIVLVAIAAASVAAVAPVAGAARHRERNIVQTAATAGQFTTLLTLAKQAGLAGVLANTGPYTVFAPTDAAFAKVPKATLAALAHDRAKLRAVLLSHVVKGRLTAAKLAKLHSVQTLNGQSLTVRATHCAVTVNGVRVLKANIRASNGIIHAIGGVLIPH